MQAIYEPTRRKANLRLTAIDSFRERLAKREAYIRLEHNGLPVKQFNALQRVRNVLNKLEDEALLELMHVAAYLSAEGDEAGYQRVMEKISCRQAARK